MSDFGDFMQRLDRGIAAVVQELAERDGAPAARETAARETAARAKPHTLRARVLPALLVCGLAAGVWVATR